MKLNGNILMYKYHNNKYEDYNLFKVPELLKILKKDLRKGR